MLFALVQASQKDTQIIVAGEGPQAIRREPGERSRATGRPANTFESIFGLPGARNPSEY